MANLVCWGYVCIGLLESSHWVYVLLFILAPNFLKNSKNSQSEKWMKFNILEFSGCPWPKYWTWQKGGTCSNHLFLNCNTAICLMAPLIATECVSLIHQTAKSCTWCTIATWNYLQYKSIPTLPVKLFHLGAGGE